MQNEGAHHTCKDKYNKNIFCFEREFAFQPNAYSKTLAHTTQNNSKTNLEHSAPLRPMKTATLVEEENERIHVHVCSCICVLYIYLMFPSSKYFDTLLCCLSFFMFSDFARIQCQNKYARIARAHPTQACVDSISPPAQRPQFGFGP